MSIRISIFRLFATILVLIFAGALFPASSQILGDAKWEVGGSDIHNANLEGWYDLRSGLGRMVARRKCIERHLCLVTSNFRLHRQPALDVPDQSGHYRQPDNHWRSGRPQ